MMLISCCPLCAQKLRQTQYMVETRAAPRRGLCQWCTPQREAMLTQYEATPKNQPRRRPKPSGPAPRDRRARYKGNWRNEEQAEGW